MSSQSAVQGKGSDVYQDVGAVVIGRNEGQRLVECLIRALAQCKHVVYADSDSRDDSVSLARELGAEVVSLTSDVPLTAARGRREGLARLLQIMPDCRYVQFLDGDCLLQPDWLAAASDFLNERPEVAAVCGRRFEAHPNATFYNRLIDLEWNTPVGEADACGGDALMRVTALREAGSFRGDLLAGEEPELCTRLKKAGHHIWRLDASMTEHDAAIHSFAEWWRRARRGGIGYAQVWSVTRKIGQPLYVRQIASALFWAIALPLIVAGTAMLVRSPLPLLILPIIWIVQVIRISSRLNSPSLRFRIRAAVTMLLVKFAEAAGVIRYLLVGTGRNNATYRVTRPAAAGRSVT